MRPGVFAVAIVLAASAGCGHNIGDSCLTNVDCSPLGDRFCDLSAPGGYCTMDGCDIETCPTESVCIRFFTPIPNRPCVFGAPWPQNGCDVDQRCLCDSSVTTVVGMSATELCSGGNGLSPPSAHCAPEISERRWCQLKCSSDSDCRAGYECRSTGTLGAEPVPAVDMFPGFDAGANGTVLPAVTFCAPMG